MSAPTRMPPRYSGLRITQLGFGAGLAIWSFRACATGHRHCPPLVEGLNRALGDDGSEGRIHCLALAKTLGEVGQRTIHLAGPGNLGVTHDELGIAKALQAAQKGDAAERDLYLTDLLGRRPPADVKDAVRRLAALFLRSGHPIFLPPDIPNRGDTGAPDIKSSYPKPTSKGPDNVHSIYQ